MCGICGIYNYTSLHPADPAILFKMNKTIIHRGPDDSGIWHEGPVGLAMRRLSIIDLHNGAQPVWNEDRSICAVYNGEIYNYEALTKTLTDKNHKFTSKCDSEVLVHLYETYGYEMLQYLKGMFAFALWDKKKKYFLLPATVLELSLSFIQRLMVICYSDPRLNACWREA